jgi:hypothetical protein
MFACRLQYCLASRILHHFPELISNLALSTLPLPGLPPPASRQPRDLAELAGAGVGTGSFGGSVWVRPYQAGSCRLDPVQLKHWRNR